MMDFDEFWLVWLTLGWIFLTKRVCLDHTVEITEFYCHTMWNNEKLTLTKKKDISSNQLFSETVGVGFTKFLPEKCERTIS